ncbi:Protein ALP1-like [Bienertia sinuspersici]
MQFIYVLPGWESSAHDNRVLRDALSRKNPLKIPQGNYYLCDAGYMNCDGFLTSFRGQRYHLSVWKNGAHPLSAQEYFNMKHSQARNVIARCFGLLKMRWGILRNTTWYRRKTVCRIILACALVHNFIRTYMSTDPMEYLVEDYMQEDNGDNIEVMETSTAWSSFRFELATEMYTTWLHSRAN